MRPLVVLLLPKASYRGEDFLAAAERAGADVLVASDRCHQLAAQWPDGALPAELREPLELRDPLGAARALAEAVRGRGVAAIVGTDDQTAIVAAEASALLGLAHAAALATLAARDKAQSRERLRAAGVPTPWFEVVARDLPADALAALAARVPYPCVVKPLVLSGSRGVIRADDPPAFAAAFERLAALLRAPQVAERRDPALERVLVEGFLPGPEIALEGLLTAGALETLAIFDKPDPLDGPFFEETLYVTPSRHAPAVQRAAEEMVAAGARALGLSHGPLHAELRLTPDGPRLLEIAARSIGGLCGRTLRFGLGITLEELVVRHALGLATPLARERAAAGVLMIPIPRGGILREVRGVDAARAVPLVEDVVISAHVDEELVALPEGASYLGFAFARGPAPADVEAALRAAQAKLEVVVTPRLAVVAT